MILAQRFRDRYAGLSQPLRSERRLELALLVLALVIGLQLVWVLLTLLRDPRVEAVPPAQDSLRVVQREAVGGIDSAASQALRARPLFWPSRRPTDVEPTAAEIAAARESVDDSGGTPAPGLKSLVVTGIYGGGDTGGAILRYKGARLRVAVGELLDGWELVSVAPSEAVFVSAGVRDTRPLLLRAVGAAADENAQDAAASAAVRGLVAQPNRNKNKNSAKDSLTLGG